MTNRKITKDMAAEAAGKMVEAIFSKKENEAYKAYTDKVDELVRLHYPSPVLGVIKEYPDYFSWCHNVYIDCEDRKRGFSALAGELLSASKYGIIVTSNEFDEVYDLFQKYNAVLKSKKEMYKDIYDKLLFELKYERTISKVLPEAIQYIPFPAQIAPPALMENRYTDLRKLLQNV